MGMFDWLTCEYPLPDGHNIYSFQTKDTDAQGCESYKITKEGRLLHQNEEVGSWIDVNRKGPIRFYDLRGDDEWICYLAKFENGEVFSVERIERAGP